MPPGGLIIPGAVPVRPNVFREDAGRNMPAIFPPVAGGPDFQFPQVLLPTVQLVHDYLSTTPYSGVSIWDNVGAADTVSIVQATPVPANMIWLVDSLGIFTDDTATRILTLFLHYINAAGDFSIPLWSQDSGAVASRWWGFPYGRFVMPPGSKLELTASALTAGKKIRYTAAYLQVPWGQFVPRT